MCGRFTLEPTMHFYERFQIENRLDNLIARYNIAPSQDVPVIISKSPKKAVLMRWGLIPHWAKDPKIGYKMINARIETLKEKPSFKKSLANKRCLVPASGFYEWQVNVGGKVPHYIYKKEESLFAFAGLYDTWETAEGRGIYTFTIITTESKGIMKKIHNRMPVILKQEHEDAWVSSNITNPDDALILLDLQSDYGLKEYEVSKRVNKPQNDSSDLIDKVVDY